MNIEEVLGSPGRIKILKLIVKYGEVNVTRLAREAGMHYRLVNKHIEVLKKNGVVLEKRFGRARIVALNLDNPKARLIAEFLLRLESLENSPDG